MKKVYLMLAILVQVSVVFSQTYFVKGYTGVNANDPNALNIVNADIDGVKLQAGDEIAVFDGNLCCGVITLTGEIDSTNNLYIPTLNASAESFSGFVSTSDLNGFRQGNKIYLRFWDKSENKEYHNIVLTFIDPNTKKPTNEQTFTSNTTFFVAASTKNTDKTWNPVEDEGSYPDRNWSTPENWNPNGVPEPFSDVIIPNGIPTPIIVTNVGAYCGKITLNNTTSVQLNSSSTGTGSLIVSSDISGLGPVSARRWVVNNGWHLVSSPVDDQNISSFVTNAANDIPLKDGNRGMMDYSEGDDNWNSYFTNTTSGQISKGIGYCVRRSTSEGFINFTGTLSGGNVPATISRSKNGWNLVGNPFPSAMYVRQEVNGFLTVNKDKLDLSFLALYLWDPVTEKYAIVNNSEGQANLASGQGFFVKAAAGGNVTFTQAMQVHQTNAPFKSGSIQWPSVVLNAKAAELTGSTKINFNEEMTLGLDPGYDAGILRSGKGFDIYSKLVTDNGVDFMVQALPGKSGDSYVVPIGVDAVIGGEVVFSAQATNLPVGYDLMIEDKLTNNVTNLKNGELYVANVASDTKGTGRFYLHVGSSVQTAIKELQKDDILIYTIGQTMYIKGNVSSDAQFLVYSIDGRLINQFGAKSQNLNQINIAGYAPGVYLINVLDNVKHKPVKFVVGK